MNDKDLSPRALAGIALGEDPALFLSFRILPDRSVVVVDPVGRKFVLTQADLARVQEQVIEQRLKARGRALVSDIRILNEAEKAETPTAAPAPKDQAAPKKLTSKPAGKSAKPASKPAPKTASKPASKPAVKKTAP